MLRKIRESQGDPGGPRENQGGLGKLQENSLESWKWQMTSKTDRTQGNPGKPEKNQGEPVSTTSFKESKGFVTFTR